MLSCWNDLDKIVNRWGLVEDGWEYRIVEKGDSLFYTSYKCTKNVEWSDEEKWFDSFVKARNYLQREIGMKDNQMYRYVEYKRLGKTITRKLKSANKKVKRGNG